MVGLRLRNSLLLSARVNTSTDSDDATPAQRASREVMRMCPAPWGKYLRTSSGALALSKISNHRG
jgi:hypothetical protein